MSLVLTAERSRKKTLPSVAFSPVRPWELPQPPRTKPARASPMIAGTTAARRTIERVLVCVVFGSNRPRLGERAFVGTTADCRDRYPFDTAAMLSSERLLTAGTVIRSTRRPAD